MTLVNPIHINSAEMFIQLFRSIIRTTWKVTKTATTISYTWMFIIFNVTKENYPETNFLSAAWISEMNNIAFETFYIFPFVVRICIFLWNYIQLWRTFYITEIFLELSNFSFLVEWKTVKFLYAPFHKYEFKYYYLTW